MPKRTVKLTRDDLDELQFNGSLETTFDGLSIGVRLEVADDA